MRRVYAPIMLVIFCAVSFSVHAKTPVRTPLHASVAKYSAYAGLQCRGHEHYPCDFLKQGVSLKVGDTVTEEHLDQIRRRLSRLIGIESSQVSAEDNGESTVIVITVEERSSIDIGASLGAIYEKKVPGVLARILVVDDNWLGGGEWLSVDFRNLSLGPDKESQANVFHGLINFRSATLADGPWFYELGLRVFDTNFRNAKDPIEEKEFRRERVETSISGGFGRKLWPEVGSFRVSEIAGGVRLMLNGHEKLQTGSANFEQETKEFDRTAGVYARWFGDSRDDLFFPQKGSMSEVIVEGIMKSGGGTLVPWSAYWQSEQVDDGRVLAYRLGANKSDPYQPFNYLPVSVGYGRDSRAEWVARQRWLLEAGFNYLPLNKAKEFDFNMGVRVSLRVLVTSFGPLEFFAFGLF